jgi:hypothetical protein
VAATGRPELALVGVARRHARHRERERGGGGGGAEIFSHQNGADRIMTRRTTEGSRDTEAPHNL